MHDTHLATNANSAEGWHSCTHSNQPSSNDSILTLMGKLVHDSELSALTASASYMALVTDMLALKKQYAKTEVNEDTKRKAVLEPRVAVHALLLIALQKEC
eukprot:5465122-Amphidinium_carterae.1